MTPLSPSKQKDRFFVPRTPPSTTSSSVNSPCTSWGLSPTVQQQLIGDIDARGGLAVVKVAKLCDDFPDRYGVVDSSLRRQVQNKVGKWKKLSAAAFDKLRRDLASGRIPQPVTPQETPKFLTPTKSQEHRDNSFSPFLRKSAAPSCLSQTINMSSLPWDSVQFGPGKFSVPPSFQRQ